MLYYNNSLTLTVSLFSTLVMDFEDSTFSSTLVKDLGKVGGEGFVFWDEDIAPLVVVGPEDDVRWDEDPCPSVLSPASGSSPADSRVAVSSVFFTIDVEGAVVLVLPVLRVEGGGGSRGVGVVGVVEEGGSRGEALGGACLRGTTGWEISLRLNFGRRGMTPDSPEGCKGFTTLSLKT